MTTRNRELAGIIDDSGNITATGNLTVAGNLAQQSSTTTTYADNLLELNTGASSNSNDLGFVFERGSTGDNAILIWDESNDGFIVGTTSSTGTATGNITVTAGDFAAGKITVDNILINGTTIGHTSDTDLLTFASGVLTVAGEISVTTLDIGGTNVTSTAAELNILDGVNSTAAELNILDGVTATAAEINFLDGDTSATGTTLASADRVIVNDGGTMKQVALSDFETFFESEIDTFSTIDINGGSIDGATVGAASASTGAFTTLSASGALTGTLGTAAQGNVTSLGTLTALTVDNLGINGNTITANSGAVNITPAGGSAIVLDGTINVDAGVVTGATSITSTAFVGGLTGNVTGNASGTALTVTQAAQTAITSVGTLTGLTVTSNATINGLTKLDNWGSASGHGRIEFGNSGEPYIQGIDTGNGGSGAYLKFGINTTDVIYIKSNYNVGIGTTSPGSLLHIKGGSPVFTIESDTNSTSRNWDLSTERVEGGDLSIRVGTSLAATPSVTAMYFNKDAQVGIGTTSPSARLDIAGMVAGEQALLITSARNDALSNGLARINITDVNCPFTGLQIDYAGTGTPLHIKRADGTALIVESTNDQNNTGDRIAMEFRTDAAQGIAKIIGGKEGNYQSSGARSGYLAFQTINANTYAERMRITSTGNVGIGEATPIRKLSVVGSSGAGSTLLLHMDADTANGETRIDFKADSTNDDRRIKGAIIFKRSDPGTRGTGSMHFCVNSVNSDANVSTSETLLYLGEDGDVQIGNPAVGAAGNNLIIMPAARFYLDAGGDTYIDEYSANEVGITTGGSRKFALSGGNLYHAGSLNSNHNFSDERLKENIVVIPNALEKVSSLRGITFTRKDDGSVGTGLIAQELEKVLPEAVYESKTIDSLENPDAEKYKAIRYETTVGLLVEAVKELSEKNNTLEARIATLEG